MFIEVDGNTWINMDHVVKVELVKLLGDAEEYRFFGTNPGSILGSIGTENQARFSFADRVLKALQKVPMS